jgi:hypothetical protein
MEEWKVVTDFPLYEVSSFGRLRRGAKIFNLKPLRNGYVAARMVNEKGWKHKFVHTLVAREFVNNPDELPFVDHKNRIRHDNNSTNLRWVTAAENRSNQKRDAFLGGHRRKIHQHSLDGKIISTWNSALEAQRKLKINNIGRCCRGIKKTAGGYKWSFADLESEPDESWVDLDVDGTLIEVSSKGRIRVKNGGILSGSKHPLGYLRVCINGTAHLKHRLVCLAFKSHLRKPGHDFVHHKDGVRTNNYVDNLEWVTTQQNVQHSWDTGGNASKKRKIEEIDENGTVIAKYNTMTEAARSCSSSTGSISEVCYKRRKKAKGKMFRFAPIE